MSAAAGVKKAAASYWRVAGLTYLDALNASTSALRRWVICVAAAGRRTVALAGAAPRRSRLRCSPGCCRILGERLVAVFSLPFSFSGTPVSSLCGGLPLTPFVPPRRRHPRARSVLKEPARSEAMGKSGFRFREFSYEAGKEMPSKEVASDPSMRKDAK